MPTLRLTIRTVNKTLNVLKVDKHPDKTFIGKVERGFDFLGYFLKPEMVNVSISTLKRFALRISLLYEQGVDYLSIGGIREALPKVGVGRDRRMGKYESKWV